MIKFADCTFITVFSQSEGRKDLVYLTHTSLFVKGKVAAENFNSSSKLQSPFIHHIIWFQHYCGWDAFICCIFFVILINNCFCHGPFIYFWCSWYCFYILRLFQWMTVFFTLILLYCLIFCMETLDCSKGFKIYIGMNSIPKSPNF